ncbi:MAG: NUDIX hydrolase [Syntrophobacterales bacterium]|jgi:ADP-ribose pyrophosphatase YjhB (NUDIX family)
MRISETCPQCGHRFSRYRNPTPTVDIIIEYQSQGLVLIERQKPPYGFALPGGFVEYGESLEEAAVREAKEETGLDVKLLGQFHSYSDPHRDPRQHNITTVFIARGAGTPQAASDAKSLAIFSPDNLPSPLAFDHAQILKDYLRVRHEWLSRG